MTPEEYCRDKTRGSGSSFYYAFIFLPEDQRRAMMALYAFCREVDDVADEIKDQDVAMHKIGFWRQEIQHVFHAKPQHPVGIELKWAKDNFSLDEELFYEMIDGMVMDISRQQMVKDSDLSLYCYRVAGVVGLLSIEIFGYSNRKARDFATSLGEALQLTNILRDVEEDAQRGRIYLSQQSRVKFGVTDQDIKNGTMTPQLNALLAFYAEKAEAAYQQAFSNLPEEDRVSLRPSIVMATIYYAHLKLLKDANYNVWQQPARMMPLRKLWLAWRAWRYETKAEKKAKQGNPLPVRLNF